MRQFVLGLIVAALAWWGYDQYFSDPAQAGSRSSSTRPNASGSQAAVPGGGMDLLKTSSPNTGAPQPGAAQPATGDAAPKPTEAAASLAKDLDELMPRVVNGDAEAVSKAWAAVATGRLGGELARVLESLRPRGDDFESHLIALGRDNAFLHSAPGREAAAKTLALAMALPDPQAVQAGSQLVHLMVRGRIERSDTEVRAAVDRAYQEHRIRVDRWVCNPANVAGARSYTVQSGDVLDTIARRFRRDGLAVESGTIQVLNRISNPRALRVGQKLKVPVAPVSALLEKRSYALMLFVGDELLRLYWVGHGEHDRTPVTEFEVIAKQERPEWTAPDGNRYPYGHPKNILGEYFIKLGHDQYSGFGAHGTPMPETICTQSSMGCIRMFDQDIAELFQVLPRGAIVTVRATESVR